MSQLRIGLTGGIASGKSTVAARFREHGITIIDADQIARDMVLPGEPTLDAIRHYFGERILQPSGELDRQALRECIFASKADKQWLNELLHPRIRTEMIQQAKAAPSPYCILDIPLLVENQLQSLVARVLVVDVPEPVQCQRVEARDGVSIEQAQRILDAQASRQQRLSAADDVIDNTGSLKQLYERVDALHQDYLARADNAF